MDRPVRWSGKEKKTFCSSNTSCAENVFAGFCSVFCFSEIMSAWNFVTVKAAEVSHSPIVQLYLHRCSLGCFAQISTICAYMRVSPSPSSNHTDELGRHVRSRLIMQEAECHILYCIWYKTMRMISSLITDEPYVQTQRQASHDNFPLPRQPAVTFCHGCAAWQCLGY